MPQAKVFISILMVLTLIALSGVSVWAAPRGEEPTPTPEPTEEPTAEPTEELPDEGPPTVHPVVSALAEFFADTLGLDYDEIMGYHEDSVGFGVIANACWISSMLYNPEAKDNVTPADILEAKKNGDFSSITLPEGGTAKNWGQFKKAVLSSNRAEKNLGAIMSCCAEGEQEQDKSRDRDRDRDQNQEQAKDKGQGSNEEAGGPPAEPPGKNKEEGSGKPDTPPGQDKGGGNDKGGSGGKGKGK